MPHNCARHELNSLFVGFPKADVLAAYCNQVLGSTKVADHLIANVVRPETAAAAVAQALNEAAVVADFSASVADVPENFAVKGGTARRLSAFLSPSGNDLVLLVEDAFHSPQPRIFSPVESTIKSIGPSWDRVRGGTATIWFRRESVVWSGALRLRPIKRSSESRNPSVWRSGRLKTTRSCQRGPDREVRVPPLASAKTVLRWYPRGNCILAQPDRDVAAAEGLEEQVAAMSTPSSSGFCTSSCTGS